MNAIEAGLLGFGIGIIVSLLWSFGSDIRRSRLSKTDGNNATARDLNKQAADDNRRLTENQRRAKEALDTAADNNRRASELVKEAKSILDKYNSGE